MKKNSEGYNRLAIRVNDLQIRHSKMFGDIRAIVMRMNNSISDDEAKNLLGKKVKAVKRKQVLELRKLTGKMIKIHQSVESENTEVRSKSEYVMEWLSDQPEIEIDLDEFEIVLQDSDSEERDSSSDDDIEQEVAGVEQEVAGLEQELGVLGNELGFLEKEVGDLEKEASNLDGFEANVKKWDRGKMDGLETQFVGLLDGMKDMVSLTKGMAEKLKMVGNLNPSQDLNSRETCKVTALLEFIDQELSKMVGLEETEFGSSKVVLLLEEILQSADDEMDEKMSLKEPFGKVEASFEEFEMFDKELLSATTEDNDEMEEMESRIAKIRAAKESCLKECEKEMKEIGSMVKELKETVGMFGAEHESVIQTYFKSMKQKMVDTYFKLSELKMKY